MAGAYSPNAIQQLFDTVKQRMPSAALGGIYANKPGYHNARNQLSSGDYSVQKPPDKEGDGWAAAALDITPNAADQKTMSQRLLNAKNDSRMAPIREFFGSTNGTSVCGWDYYGGYAVTSDSSHLWHVHISVLRKYTNDVAALQKVADVITGVSSGGGDSGGGGSTGGDEMKFNSRVRSKEQNVTGDWKTLSTNDDNNPGWDLTGPVQYQAQANVSISGLASGARLQLRFFSLDNKGNQNQRAYNWPIIELTASGSIVQMGSIGKPASGWSRWLRLEARVTTGTCKVTRLQSTTFSQ